MRSCRRALLLLQGAAALLLAGPVASSGLDSLGLALEANTGNGRITLSAAGGGGTDDDELASVACVQIKSVIEVDSDGNTVGKSGSDKHSIQSFASQKFEYTTSEE